MCLGSGGGYMPPPVQKAPDPEPGPASPPDMVNDTIIPNANPRDQQEAARNEFDPPNKTKLKAQSDKNTGLY
tara:strand:- start:22 stop:237 length:216 start_codon:yes stop_codon:yes gene_type:complete